MIWTCRNRNLEENEIRQGQTFCWSFSLYIYASFKLIIIEKLFQNDDFQAIPNFSTGSNNIVKFCIQTVLEGWPVFDEWFRWGFRWHVDDSSNSSFILLIFQVGTRLTVHRLLDFILQAQKLGLVKFCSLNHYSLSMRNSHSMNRCRRSQRWLLLVPPAAHFAQVLPFECKKLPFYESRFRASLLFECVERVKLPFYAAQLR